jgi:alkylated DNA repair protein alkB family protein 6
MKPVGPLPTVYYVNSIISDEDATALVAAIDAEDQWIDLKRRRLQRRGGEVTPSGLQKAEALPPYLAALSAALVQLGIFPPHLAPNHVLINEYLGGQGILAHTDGPAYHPCVTTISLGCDALMHFTAPRGGSSGGDGKYLQQLVLRKNSLVVFTDDAYKNVLHSIADAYEEVVGAAGPCVNLESSHASDGEVLERTRRISITIRHVPLAVEESSTLAT